MEKVGKAKKSEKCEKVEKWNNWKSVIILNVDTFSLSNEVQGQYYGWIREGMTLRGQTSGALAKVSNVRLISDISATLIGSYYIPDPNNMSFPRFETGSKVFTLTDDIDNNQDPFFSHIRNIIQIKYMFRWYEMLYTRHVKI